ncbi:MAG: HEAT repeat domain-containing protein [Thermodesulfobacteriota bacterium]
MEQGDQRALKTIQDMLGGVFNASASLMLARHRVPGAADAVFQYRNTILKRIDHSQYLRVLEELKPESVGVLLGYMEEGSRHHCIEAAEFLDEMSWEPKNPETDRSFHLMLMLTEQWQRLGALGDKAAETMGDVLLGVAYRHQELSEEKILETLERFNTPGSRQVLIKVLEFGDVTLRGKVAWSLEYLKAKEAVPKLLAALDLDLAEKKSFCSSGTKEIISALGALGDSRAVTSLIKILTDTDWFERGEAAYSLGRLRDERALEPLIQLLRNRSDRSLQDYAARGLGELGNSGAVRTLLDFLEECYDYQCETVIYALGKIGDRRAAHSVLKWLVKELGPHKEKPESWREQRSWQDLHPLLGVLGKVVFQSAMNGKPSIELLTENTAITSNILHLFAEKPDVQVENFWDGTYFNTKFDFSEGREMAHKELLARGNPKYDEKGYLDEDAWTATKMDND